MLLLHNKWLVYDFDHIGQTALIWACKRNNYKMVKFLVEKNSDVNQEDIASRTALYYAIKNQNNKIFTVRISLLDISFFYKFINSTSSAIWPIPSTSPTI